MRQSDPTKEGGMDNELAYLRRQMEELRERGLWPVSKLLAERDALREAAQALVTARAEGAPIEPWGALIAALEHPE